MCNIFSDYAVTVQLVLGFSIIFVLVVEYIIERFRKDRPRSLIQFWFDSFKLCCGALVSHGFNVWVAYILADSNRDVDECAVYTIAFYYEATGVTVVQMFQYGLVKYTRRKYLELYHKHNGVWYLSTKIFFWISYPGHYTTPEDNPTAAAERSRFLQISQNNNNDPKETTALMSGNNDTGRYNTQALDHSLSGAASGSNEANNQTSGTGNRNVLSDEAILAHNMGDDYSDFDGLMDDNSRDFYRNVGNITFLQTRMKNPLYLAILVVATIVGTILVCLFSWYTLGYDWYIIILIAICAILLFITLGICTPACLWQTTSWVCIKIVERSLWTVFVYVQKNDFITYSELISFGNDVLEAVLYIAIIPLILGIMMFWAFSQIARMNIPFVDIKVE